MDRTLILWSIALFLGGSILFRTIADATQDEGVVVSLGLQAVVLAVIVGAIVLIARRSGRGG